MINFIGENNRIEHSLQLKKKGKLRICVISDTHETHKNITNKIPTDCDFVIHTGDICMTGRYRSRTRLIQKLIEFNEWTKTLPIKKKRFILIAGNHDFILEVLSKDEIDTLLDNIIYLENDVFTFNKFHFIGCPYSSGVSGNNAFQSKEFKEKSNDFIKKCVRDYTDKNKNINENIILLTHVYLQEYRDLLKPGIYVSGHNHFNEGVTIKNDTISVNATSVNLNYEQVYDPIIFDIPRTKKAPDEKSSNLYKLQDNISKLI